MVFVQKSYTEEIQLEKELQDRLSDITHIRNGTMAARVTLVRFLRAYNYDMKKAEENLRKYIDFKSERNLWGVGARELDLSMKRLIPIDVVCYDLEERPVLYTILKNWNCEEVLKRGDVMQFENFFFHVFERALHHLTQLNSRRPPNRSLITNYLHISDYTGTGFSTFMNLKAMKIFSATAHINKTFFLDVPISFNIHTPAYFSPMKALCAGDPGKFFFFGKRSEWEGELKKCIEFSKIDSFIGKDIVTVG